MVDPGMSATEFLFCLIWAGITGEGRQNIKNWREGPVHLGEVYRLSFKLTEFQYSSGSNIVVTERSHSVMIHNVSSGVTL